MVSTPSTAKPSTTERCESAISLKLDVLAEYLGFSLHRALFSLRRNFVVDVGNAEVRLITFNVMVLVGANPGILPGELAAALTLDKSSVTNLIKKLEKRGWVERNVRSNDRRCKGLFLSPQGANALGKLKSITAIHSKRLDCIFTPTEKEQFINFLQRIR